MVINRLKQISTGVKNSLKNSKPPSSSYLVALDIGTEFVKALIGQVKDDEIIIKGVGKVRQGLSDMHSGAISDISSVVANCDKALTQAEQQAGTSARKTVIGIAGELVKGTTNTIRYKRSDPEKEITLVEMEYILNRVQDKAYERAKKQVAWETGNKDVDVKLVNSALVSIHIDAYKVSNPIGFQGKDVAVQIYTAFAPMIHIGALERTAKELDLDLIAVAAEPFAVTRAVIGNDASSSLSAITIDVGGGTTDIAVVNDGGVEGTKMFSIGGRAFTKSLASEFATDFETAEDMKLKLSSDGLADDIKGQVRTVIDKTISVWQDGVSVALSEFDQVDHLPNQILLCGGGASLKPLIKSLSNQDWFKELPFTKRPAIRLISPQEVAGITDESNSANDHTFITAMGLLRVGLDTNQTVDDADSITDKLNKLLKI